MAGIGFELKKLFGNKGYINITRAYLYTALVTVGPTILCMFMIVSLQLFMIFMGVGIAERELFIAAITYSFVFSLILTSGFAMVVTRYLSDKIYLKEYDEILPSLYGVLTICLVIGGAAGIIFYAFSPLSLLFKFGAYSLFMGLIIIWLLSIYLSALKDYMKIVKGFVMGVSVTLACSYILLKFTGFPKAISCLMAVDLGIFVIILSLMMCLKRFFKSKEKGYFKFIAYFDKYISLSLISFAYTLGIYVHNFVFWTSDYAVVIEHTYVFSPIYDVPAFYAFLTMLTAMVIFIAKVETSFYEKYKNYYSTVLGRGTLDDIFRTKKEMHNVLVQETTYIMEMQLFFTLVFMVLGLRLLPRIGFSGLSMDIFSIMTLGSYACVIFFIVMLLLLYFDDRKGALIVAVVFVTTNTIFSIITLALGESFFGFGFFISSIISVCAVLVRISLFIKNIDYYTFCSQPIVYKEREGYFTRLVSKLYG